MKKIYFRNQEQNEKVNEIKELISNLELIKAESEWNYPLDYAIAIDEAIKKLELMEEKDD